MSVRLRVFIPMIKHHHHQQIQEEKQRVVSTRSSCAIIEVSQVKIQSRGLESRTEEETTEGCCLLPCSPWLVQPAFLFLSGPPAQRVDTPTMVWTLLPHQPVIKKMPYRPTEVLSWRFSPTFQRDET